MMNGVELSSCSRFCFLFGRQFLLFVLENNSIIHFIFFALYVFKSHRVALYYSLHHLFCIPRSNRVIIATRVEHMVCKRKGNDTIIMSRKFFDLLHIWPMVDSYFPVIAACVKIFVQKLHSPNPSISFVCVNFYIEGHLHLDFKHQMSWDHRQQLCFLCCQIQAGHLDRRRKWLSAFWILCTWWFY